MINAKVIGILTLLIVLCAFLAITVPDSFLTGNNIENLLRRTALYGILGIGVAFVIITSGIDLSIGSVVCLSGCLLAMFLRVEYAPPDQQPILAVFAEQRQLILPPGVDSFQPGDRIRYYGGRRAATAICTIESIEQTLVGVDDQQVTATVLTVDQPFTRNDYVGYVAKVYGLREIGETSVSIDMPTRPLQARDQLVIVHPKSGLKQLPVMNAEPTAESIKLELKGEVGSQVTDQWVAVPLQRKQRMPILAGVALVLAIGAGLGILHGLLITKVGLQPFVVTLCGLLFYRGISRWLVVDQPQGFGAEYDDTLRTIATAKLTVIPASAETPGFGIPYPFFILLVVAILSAVFLGKTIWGRYMLALGRSKEAAEYSGVNTDTMTIIAYVICTALAALGGMLFALDANSVSPSSFGNFFELYAIAAAVLGGCSLRGGEGGIFGVVIGTALMQTLYNLIILVKISDTLQFAIIGAVILIGVAVDELLKRWAVRRRASKIAQTT